MGSSATNLQGNVREFHISGERSPYTQQSVGYTSDEIATVHLVDIGNELPVTSSRSLLVTYFDLFQEVEGQFVICVSKDFLQQAVVDCFCDGCKLSWLEA